MSSRNLNRLLLLITMQGEVCNSPFSCSDTLQQIIGAILDFKDFIVLTLTSTAIRKICMEWVINSNVRASGYPVAPTNGQMGFWKELKFRFTCIGCERVGWQVRCLRQKITTESIDCSPMRPRILLSLWLQSTLRDMRRPDTEQNVMQ